jgi:hypothetical protein
MVDYVESMVKGFPKKDMLGAQDKSLWNENLFKVNQLSPSLSKKMAEQFHTTMYQGLFACKRARPDITPAIAYLTTRVRNPNQDDWMKLARMMKFLKQTRKDCLTLKSDGGMLMPLLPYTSIGGGTTMGKGAVTSISQKQGLNT